MATLVLGVRQYLTFRSTIAVSDMSYISSTPISELAIRRITLQVVTDLEVTFTTQQEYG